MILPRSSGILLHITSLPSRFGIGDLGPSAYRFVDILHHANQNVWQVLPIVPAGYGHSPYASPSTFAGNPLLISPDKLVEDGLLDPHDFSNLPAFGVHRVAYHQVIDFKFHLLACAYQRFEAGHSNVEREAFELFCRQHRPWLDDYALFAVLKLVHEGKEWVEWSPALQMRDRIALKKARQSYADEVRQQKFWQFLFDRQWRALKKYCTEKSVKIFGDLPIYVAHDSADVWANRELFHLNDCGRQTVVAGVPPDYFSDTGQRWGNPIYRWDRMAAQDYRWWKQRFQSILRQVDYVRLDHFRGFEAYWEVPASEETAIHGTWIDGPKNALFEQLTDALGPMSVIAENLGVITPGVTSIMDQFEFPGMAILQFAFDGDASSEFLPHNYKQQLVAYTGTHDNDTLLGWWFNDSSTQDAGTKQRARDYACDYLNLYNTPDDEIHWAFNQALLASVANLAILPLQDVIGLNSSGRMNTPGTVGDQNWAWRFDFDMLPAHAIERLKHLTRIYGRVHEV